MEEKTSKLKGNPVRGGLEEKNFMAYRDKTIVQGAWRSSVMKVIRRPCTKQR